MAPPVPVNLCCDPAQPLDVSIDFSRVLAAIIEDLKTAKGPFNVVMLLEGEAPHTARALEALHDKAGSAGAWARPLAPASASTLTTAQDSVTPQHLPSVTLVETMLPSERSRAADEWNELVNKASDEAHERLGLSRNELRAAFKALHPRDGTDSQNDPVVWIERAPSLSFAGHLTLFDALSSCSAITEPRWSNGSPFLLSLGSTPHTKAHRGNRASKGVREVLGEDSALLRKAKRGKRLFEMPIDSIVHVPQRLWDAHVNGTGKLKLVQAITMPRTWSAVEEAKAEAKAKGKAKAARAARKGSAAQSSGRRHDEEDVKEMEHSDEEERGDAEDVEDQDSETEDDFARDDESDDDDDALPRTQPHQRRSRPDADKKRRHRSSSSQLGSNSWKRFRSETLSALSQEIDIPSAQRPRSLHGDTDEDEASVELGIPTPIRFAPVRWALWPTDEILWSVLLDEEALEDNSADLLKRLLPQVYAVFARGTFNDLLAAQAISRIATRHVRGQVQAGHLVKLLSRPVILQRLSRECRDACRSILGIW